jgi:hypothetical protein
MAPHLLSVKPKRRITDGNKICAIFRSFSVNIIILGFLELFIEYSIFFGQRSYFFWKILRSFWGL